MQKLLIILCAAFVMDAAFADTRAFVGMEGGAGIIAYDNAKDEAEINMAVSIGVNGGMKFGAKESLYNFGFTGFTEIGASPLPNLDDNHAKFWGASVTFDNYIRMQKSWKKALVLSAGYGVQNFDFENLVGTWIGAVGYTERFDTNMDWTMRFLLFLPSGETDGFNGGFRVGIRYSF